MDSPRTPTANEKLTTLAAEILRFTGGCEKPHRNGEANPHVHLEVSHRWGQRLAAIASDLRLHSTSSSIPSEAEGEG